MISTVQMPLPMRAAIAPSDCPQRCAPSPESLMTSMMCSLSVVRVRPAVPAAIEGDGAWGGASFIFRVRARFIRPRQAMRRRA
jgi:hypothetical protein